MKKITLFATICLLLSATGKSQSSSPDSSLFGKKWYVKKIHKLYGNDLPAFKTEEVKGKTVFIKFNKEKGSAGGNGGCNTFGGTLVVKGRSISITEIISTQMYCEGVQQTENDFFNALRKATRFEIRNNSLFIYQDKLLMLELRRE